jgi:hypothetical protein
MWTEFKTTRAPSASGGEHVAHVPNPDDKPIKAVRVLDAAEPRVRHHLSGDRYSAEYDTGRKEVKLTFRSPVNGEVAL